MSVPLLRRRASLNFKPIGCGLPFCACGFNCGCGCVCVCIWLASGGLDSCGAGTVVGVGDGTTCEEMIAFSLLLMSFSCSLQSSIESSSLLLSPLTVPIVVVDDVGIITRQTARAESIKNNGDANVIVSGLVLEVFHCGCGCRRPGNFIYLMSVAH